MPPSTIPPAPMLNKKLLREGVTPDAACATSGTTMDAVRAAAVKAVTVFSLRELLTTTKRLDGTQLAVFGDETLSGLKKEAVGGTGRLVFMCMWVSGIAMETAQLEAIDELDWSCVCVVDEKQKQSRKGRADGC